MQSKDERARGLTIDYNETTHFFTDTYYYALIDAPGHRDYVKNFIRGGSLADVALLLVPANKGLYEASIAKGNHKKGEVQGQTRHHARLCHLLGIEQIIVGVNRMDEVEYSEERFLEIKNEIDKMLTKIGYKTKKIPFIPMCGLYGDNLVQPSQSMPWYSGSRRSRSAVTRSWTRSRKWCGCPNAELIRRFACPSTECGKSAASAM